ncbi:MAG: zinc-binding protein [Phycisphaerae bacterium]|nr:MAG: zinc-binding protein [Phycisphaerae bacterium]
MIDPSGPLEPTMSFEDKTISCADCGTDFIHSASDQERYAERGFTNEPKRCRDCREKRKAQGGGGGGGGRGGYGGGGGGGGYGGGRSDREMHEATCSTCGTQTTVPFKPTEGRPVLCRDCFRASRD